NGAGGMNGVRGVFGKGVNSFGILYIHEYSGIDKAAPLDVTIGATGTSSAMSSGSVTTTNASDLLFGGGASKTRVTQGGSGYTVRSTGLGNLTEDRSVTVTGAYSATATQKGNAWVMQLTAFKPAATADPTAPSVPTGLSASAVSTSQINLSWAASTDNVGVTGYRVFRNGSQIGTSSTASYQDTGLSPSTSYTYTVSAFD